MTPLQTAAKYSNVETVRLLLDYNADRMLKSNDNKLALHYAAEHCNPGILDLLLRDKSPEQAKTRDNKNQLPWMIAKEGKHDDAAESLKNKAECMYQ